MKKIKLLTFIIFIIFFLNGCSIDWNNEKDKKITGLEKQIEELKKEKENDLFEKKQECAKYKDKIQKEVDYKFGKVEKFNYIKEIFYSTNLKTCIYTINHTNIWGIYDYLENKIVLELESPLKCGCEDTQKKFDAKIKELKGE